MKIREYNDNDKLRLVELLRLNTPAFFSSDEEKDFIYYLDNHAHHYFVIEVDNIIVACGGFNLVENGHLAKISWDIVHPLHHDTGLGTQLTDYRIMCIKNIPTVSILSVRTSQLVYKFYEKFGLELCEVAVDYWATGFDLYRLECKIEAAHIYNI